MLVLIGLIHAKKTVIFHSLDQKKAWIFPVDGSSCRLVRSSSIDTANVPELDDFGAFYIYDAKAGYGEPVQCSAKLVMFSSTNHLSYQQTQRRPGVVRVFYPSLREEEFDIYASELKISSDIVKRIKQIIGHGKIRSLSTPVNQVGDQVKEAIARFDFGSILVYASSGNTFEPGTVNPAILLDAYVKEENIKKPSLLDRYSFGEAGWTILSKSVQDAIITKYQSRAEEFLAKIVVSAGQTRSLEILGVGVGRIFEILTPGLISSHGLAIDNFREGDVTMIGGNLMSLPAGFTVQECDVNSDINYILTAYTDPKVIYSFCGNQAAFDYFIPPNNFLQLTGTLTEKGRHTLSLSTVRTICEVLQKSGLQANFITTIKFGEENKWNKIPQSFVVDDAEVVKEINVKEQFAAVKGIFKLGGTRSFERLPDGTKQKLENLRQYIGVVNFQRK